MVEAGCADVRNMLLEAEVSRKNHSEHSKMLTWCDDSPSKPEGWKAAIPHREGPCERSVANRLYFFSVFLLSLPIISASLSNIMYSRSCGMGSCTHILQFALLCVDLLGGLPAVSVSCRASWPYLFHIYGINTAMKPYRTLETVASPPKRSTHSRANWRMCVQDSIPQLRLYIYWRDWQKLWEETRGTQKRSRIH